SYLFALSQPLSTVLFLFFFLLLRPPRSPLFPYTTLFRSRLVEALHHGRLSDGVRHVFGLRGLDQFPVLRRRQIDRNVVAVGGRTVNVDVGGELFLQAGDLLVDVLIGDIGVRNRGGQVREVGQFNIGTYIEFGGDLDGFAVVEFGQIDVGLAQRLDFAFLHGLAVPVRQRVIHRLVQHGRPADSLIDNRRRHLALPDAGHVDLLTDRFIRLIQLRLELLEGHLDGELDPRRAQAFGAAFHVRLLHSNVATLVAGYGCAVRPHGLPVTRRSYPSYREPRNDFEAAFERLHNGP